MLFRFARHAIPFSQAEHSTRKETGMIQADGSTGRKGILARAKRHERDA
jgi:hypothetical protein